MTATRNPNADSESADPPWVLRRDSEALHGKVHPTFRGPHGGRVWIEDWGLVIRSPHPSHPGRIALIMAGAHSLGTGGACLCATRSALVRVIRDKLGAASYADKSAKFWVLVKATASKEDCLLDDSGVEVVDAGLL